MRTVRVTGKGNMKIRPDLTRVTVTLTEVCREYAEALKRSSEDTERIKDILSAFGFERADLKTLNFSVDVEYEGYTENGAYKQRLVGYRYRHTMKVEFASDNERLGKVLYALANSELCPELNIGYTVKNQEAAKNELIGKAVSDAKEKAAALARASGVTLKDIQTIDYSLSGINMEVRPMNSVMAKRNMSADCAEESYSIDMEPDDITVSDTVTVVWEIV